MIKKISQKVARNLHSLYPDASEDDIEVTSYALECVLNTAITTILIAAYGIYIHKLENVVLWIISYSMFRHFIGGFHASTHFRCITLSSLLCVICVSLGQWLQFPPVSALIVLPFLLIFIYRCIPVMIKQKDFLTAQQKKRYKLITAVLTTVVCILLFFCQNSRFLVYADTVFITMLFVLLSGAVQLFCNLKNQ